MTFLITSSHSKGDNYAAIFCSIIHRTLISGEDKIWGVDSYLEGEVLHPLKAQDDEEAQKKHVPQKLWYVLRYSTLRSYAKTNAARRG